MPKILGIIIYIYISAYMHVYQVELIPDFIYISTKHSKISNNSQLVKLFNTFALFSTHFSKFYFVVLLFFMWRKTLTTIFTLEMRVLRVWRGTPVYPANLHFKIMIMITTITGKLRKTLTWCGGKIRVGLVDQFWLKLQKSLFDFSPSLCLYFIKITLNTYAFFLINIFIWLFSLSLSLSPCLVI